MVLLISNVSSIISNQVPLKFKDPGCPIMSVVTGNHNIYWALLDLGASVKILRFKVYEKLGLRDLKPIKMVI